MKEAFIFMDSGNLLADGKVVSAELPSTVEQRKFIGLNSYGIVYTQFNEQPPFGIAPEVD